MNPTLPSLPFVDRIALLNTPFLWTDPRTWPWFVYLWLIVFLSGWLRSFWSWLQREQAKSWPTASGRINSAYIGEPRRFLGLTLQPDRSRTYNAILSYSYDLSGTTFSGEYRQVFGSEREAQEFLRGLQGQVVPIQYNSSKPSRSALFESTVETLLRNRVPSPDSGSGALSLDSFPNWLKPLVGLFALLSLVGLILSLWVHIGALFGRQVAPPYLFFGLHMGIFVVFFPAILVAQKRVGGTSTNRKNFWKAVTKGAPDGLRYLLYFFFVYAGINFFIFFFQVLPGTVARDHNAGPPWRGFSGHWMVFYYASFLILFSSLTSTRQRS
jgi:hypothetical protein